MVINQMHYLKIVRLTQLQSEIAILRSRLALSSRFFSYCPLGVVFCKAAVTSDPL